MKIQFGTPTELKGKNATKITEDIRRQIMTTNSKQELISKIVTLLNELSIITENVIPQKDEKLEMLTVRECAELVKGLSEHTVRQLVKQNKIPYVRAGQGNRGKILISKADLLNYLNMSA